MSSLVIELNDAGLVVADRSGILATEPGYALLAGGRITTGREAYSQARLKPRQVSSRYWANLSIEPGSAGIDEVDSAAELAFAQLESLWKEFSERVTDVVFVVPGSYRTEQLGVLLGLAQECGMTVRGMIDAAVAASGRPYPQHQLLHVDAGLHQVVTTRLDQDEAEVTARAGESFEGLGLATLRDLWARRVAERFVLSTRFDPFHQAETEQLLYERLPEWLQALERGDTVAAALPYRGESFEIELTRDDLIAASAGHYRAIAQLIAQAREPGAGLIVQISSRLAALPGLAAELARLDDAALVPLEPGQAALGALASLEAIGGDGQVRLLKHLPWRAPPAEAPAPRPEAAREPAAPAQRPTHVVYKGVAYPVDAEGIVVGRRPASGPRSIVLEGGHGGVSGAHCRLSVRDGELRLEDLSSYGTFVNEKRVAKEATLRPADVIRIGSPGEALEVIRIDDGHGA